MAHHGCGQHSLPFGDEGHPIGVGLQPRDGRQRGRTTVARQVRNEQTVAPGQQGRKLGPVRGRAAQTVDEHDRGPASSHEVAHPDALDVGDSFLEAGELCVRHGGRLSLASMNGLGGPAL